MSNFSADAIFDGGSIKRNGQTTYWNRQDFPLIVAIDDSLNFHEQSAIFEACDTWNKAVKREVLKTIVWNFRNETLPQENKLIMISKRDLGRNSFGHPINGQQRSYYHGQTAHLKAVAIWFDTNIDEQLKLLLVHEIGHALTLEHDFNDEQSIMFPHVLMLQHQPQITLEDIRLIQNMID